MHYTSNSRQSHSFKFFWNHPPHAFTKKQEGKLQPRGFKLELSMTFLQANRRHWKGFRRVYESSFPKELLILDVRIVCQNQDVMLAYVSFPPASADVFSPHSIQGQLGGLAQKFPCHEFPCPAWCVFGSGWQRGVSFWFSFTLSFQSLHILPAPYLQRLNQSFKTQSEATPTSGSFVGSTAVSPSQSLLLLHDFRDSISASLPLTGLNTLPFDCSFSSLSLLLDCELPVGRGSWSFLLITLSAQPTALTYKILH